MSYVYYLLLFYNIHFMLVNTFILYVLIYFNLIVEDN